MKRTHSLPRQFEFENLGISKCLGGGLIVLDSLEEDGLALNFIHVPSAASQMPLESWSTPLFSFMALRYAVYPPENVVVVAEQRKKYVDDFSFAQKPRNSTVVASFIYTS